MNIKEAIEMLKASVKGKSIENYKDVDPILVKRFEESLKPFADLQNELKMTGAQILRYVRDYVMCYNTGADKINTNNNGWDGFFSEYDIPYEGKHTDIKYTSDKINDGAPFQDSGWWKVVEFKKGIIVTVTVWENAITPIYTIVGNSKSIGDLIESKWDVIATKMYTEHKALRFNINISFSDMMKNGFKIVAMNKSKEEVYDKLLQAHKKFAKNITLDDIYTKDELPNLVEKFANL